jgi:nucleotide-binding universal stress UspA family protein
MPMSMQHVVVVCDGSVQGDGALRLADALAQSAGATVRAVTWLPTDYSLDGDAPIETFLASVTQQLYRTTTRLGFWRLELLMGDIAQHLARLCAEESASVVILPETLHAGIIGPRWTLRTGIPAAYVDSDPQEVGDQIVLCTCADAWSQRHAHVAAALMTAVRTIRMTARHRRVTPPCPYVQVQTVRLPAVVGTC